MITDIHSKASPNFTYLDMILDAGVTAQVAPNVPKAPDTFYAMAIMAMDILEPVRAFTNGEMVITYGFCSAARARMVAKWGTSQKGDQHAGHEVRRNGTLICARGGFAVDLKTPSAAATAAFIVANCNWDRIYFYGDDRPFHVSIEAADREPARVMVDMRGYPFNHRPPVVLDPAAFLADLLGVP